MHTSIRSRQLTGVALVLAGLWLSAAGCKSPAELIEERRPVWEQKLAKLEALEARIDALGPADRGQPPAQPLDLILSTTGRVSNGIVLDYRQLDPAWKAERLDYRYPHRRFEIETCRRMLQPLTKPLEGEDADRFIQGFREYERWLLGLKYVVVAREDAYLEPTLTGGRFSPGLVRTSAFLFSVDDGVLLGRYQVDSTIAKDVIQTVYTKKDKQEMVVRQYLSEQAQEDLYQALAQDHRVKDWLGITVRKR